MVAKDGSWFGDPVMCDGKEVITECIKEVNGGLLEPIRLIPMILMRVTVCVGFLGSIACCKWRYIADHSYLFMHFLHFVACFLLNGRNN